MVSTGSGTLADIYPRAELASVLGTFYVDLGGAARTGAGDGAVERGIYYSIDNHHLLQQLGLTLGPTIGPAIGGAFNTLAGAGRLSQALSLPPLFSCRLFFSCRRRARRGLQELQRRIRS